MKGAVIAEPDFQAMSEAQALACIEAPRRDACATAFRAIAGPQTSIKVRFSPYAVAPGYPAGARHLRTKR